MDPVTIALLVKAAIPIISPLVVAVVKHFFPGIWAVSLPVLSAGVGVATDAMTGVATGTEVSPIEGGALGLAGVGVREVVDQVKRTPLVRTCKDCLKTGPKLVAIALVLALTAPVSCATSQRAGPSPITPAKIKFLTMALAVAAQQAHPLSDPERRSLADALAQAEGSLQVSAAPPSLDGFQTTLARYVPARWAPVAMLAVTVLTEEVDLTHVAQAQGPEAMRPYFLAALDGLELALVPPPPAR
jgi:hypothetical protein